MELSSILLLPGLLFLAWIARFIQLHFLHTSKLSRYLNTPGQTHEKDSWALVTGASDGIGFGFVEELAAHGFNVILHGRNENKLDGLIKRIKLHHPTRDFRKLVLDVSKRDLWQDVFNKFVADLRQSQINLKILVNNVGGTGGSFSAFDKMADRDPEAIKTAIDVNATFPAAVTHALLPVLETQQPSLIINIGSVVAIVPPPYLGLYAGSKAFNLAWSQSLWTEMLAEKKNIEIMGVVVGRVISAHAQGKRKDTLFDPSARNFAKSALQKVGCGLPTITAHWSHDLQISALNLAPAWVTRSILIRETQKEMEFEKRGR